MTDLFKRLTGEPPAKVEPFPQGASDAELASHRLPCDVSVGNIIVRKGVPLLTLVGMTRCFHAQVYERKDES